MKVHPLTPEEDRARQVLRQLLVLREMKSVELARATDTTPNVISTKLNGTATISLTDATRFARALGVEPHVFFLEPDQAIRWALDHGPAFAGPRPSRRTSGCITAARRRRGFCRANPVGLALAS